MLKITVENPDTGEHSSAEIDEGDYLLITHKPCYEHNVTKYATGTHVITVRGVTDGEPARIEPITRNGS